MTLFLISLVAGVLTVLAPCVLPLLPVIVGGSIDSGAEGVVSKKRAITVTLALGVSVILFTLLLKASTLFITIPQSFWTGLSGGIILLFGLVTLFPELWEKVSVMGRINRQSNQVVGVGLQKKGFWGDVIVGAALGPVFSTCSPTYFIVLATVLPQRPALGFLYLLAYTVGLCVSLLLVALIGQRIVDKLGVASDPKGWFKRTLGVIFLLVGIAIISGFDKRIEAGLLSSGIFDITKVEQKLLQHK